MAKKKNDKTLNLAEVQEIFKKKIINETVDDTASSKEDVRQFICFMLSDEEFGIDIENIREVIPFIKYTRVNDTPQFIVGVFNLRGEVIALLDIKHFFGISDGVFKTTRKTKIVIVKDSGRETGLMVDYVTAARMININNIQPTPKNIEGISADYISGVVHTGDRPIILLNVNKILFSEAFNEFQ